MLNIFNKKIILLFLVILFFGFFNFVSAVDVVDNGDIVVSARVIDPNIVIPEIPENPSTGGYIIPKIAVLFKGEAYPNAEVFILKNGKKIISVFADGKGYFSSLISEEYQSTIMYTIYAEDISGDRSIIINYPVVVRYGYITELSNIRFAPTISSDKIEVISGDYISIAGYSMPNRTLELKINGKIYDDYKLTSLNNGSYKITLPLIDYPKGEYTISINYLNDARISKLLKFIVGNQNININMNYSIIPGDCNRDNIINLIDFSVLAFWYQKPNPPICVDTNRDNIIDLIDFSILAFYWTG